MEDLPAKQMDNAVVACSSFVRAGQAIRRMVTDIIELATDRKEIDRDRRATEKDLKKAKEENEKMEEKIVEMVKERDDALEAKAKMEAELPKKLSNAEDNGFNEAGEHYKQMLPVLQQKFMTAGQLMGMKVGELKGVQSAHPTSYSQGFMAGLDAAVVGTEDPRRLNIVVPEVVLSAHLQAPPAPQGPVAQPEVGLSSGGGDADGEEGGGRDNRGEGNGAVEAGQKGPEASTEQKKGDS